MPHHPVDFFGTAGNDVFAGENNPDTFHMEDGGDDNVQGKKGADVFLFGASFTAADRISGGAAHDLLVLDGDYSAGVHLADATITGLESIRFTAGHAYALWFANGNVASGTELRLDASGLLAGDSLAIHGGAETDGTFRLTGGAAQITFEGGSGNDTISGNGFLSCDLSKGGNDFVATGGGGSNIAFGAAFNANDTVTGGPGADTVVLAGDYSSGLVLAPTTLKSVETLSLTGAFSYNLTTDDANIALGKTLFVDASTLTADSVIVDAHAETDGKLRFNGGGANATIEGCANTDDITLGGGTNSVAGNGGADVFHPDAGGHDTFLYRGVGESTSTAHDTFDAFSFTNFTFDLDVSVTGIDATITGHRIRGGTSFDTDLSTFVDAAHLAAQHAVLIVPSNGPFVGHSLLVVDANGVAGYQAGADYVIDLGSNFSGGALSLANFV